MERSSLADVLAAPIRASTWRSVAYAIVALPAVFVVPLRVPLRRRLAHAVVSLPLNAVTLVVTAYVLAGVVLNVAYPIRVEDVAVVLAHPLTPYDSLDGAWGGPTLAGAWAFHGILGGVLLFGIGGAWLIRGLTWLQWRLRDRMLGPARGMTGG